MLVEYLNSVGLPVESLSLAEWLQQPNSSVERWFDLSTNYTADSADRVEEEESHAASRR